MSEIKRGGGEEDCDRKEDKFGGDAFGPQKKRVEQ